ncbi:MAG TPA: hypothetical protein VKH63_05425 [Candidatus Acidoferrum sp.]|nr:hypothetical protein [Candidatus Acidoferrum sp.]
MELQLRLLRVEQLPAVEKPGSVRVTEEAETAKEKEDVRELSEEEDGKRWHGISQKAKTITGNSRKLAFNGN